MRVTRTPLRLSTQLPCFGRNRAMRILTGEEPTLLGTDTMTNATRGAP
jgi:hypothetical protein